VRGVQNVPARIHTVIGAANYIRVTEITEALLDRFLYKAVIDPDRDPFFMYRISQQFVLHRGQIAQPHGRIPFSSLRRISDVVRGHDPKVAVNVPHELLFFANLVLRHYEAMLRRSREQATGRPKDGKPDFYISPRTQAKALDALRAIALMNRRVDVTLDDVGKLSILVCTAGVREEYEVFQKCYDSLKNHYAASHAFDQLRTMLGLQDVLDRVTLDPKLLEQPIAELADTHVKKTLAEWAKEKLGLGETTAEHNRKLLTAYLDGIVPLTDEIRSLKARLSDEVMRLFNPDVPWT